MERAGGARSELPHPAGGPADHGRVRGAGEGLGELGHVDKKLGIFMLITALIGIRIAVWISTWLFGISDTHGDKGAAADLYISVIFVIFLSGVAASMLIDVLKSRSSSEAGPSKRISEFLSRLRLFPMIYLMLQRKYTKPTEPI